MLYAIAVIIGVRQIVTNVRLLAEKELLTTRFHYDDGINRSILQIDAALKRCTKHKALYLYKMYDDAMQCQWNGWFHFGQIDEPTTSNRIKANQYKINHFRSVTFDVRSFVVLTGSDKLLIHFSWLFDIDFRIHNLRFAIIQNANGLDADVVIVALLPTACCLLLLDKVNMKEMLHTLTYF